MTILYLTMFDDKVLLLMGILHRQKAHGYELSGLLGMPGIPISIGRANIYQLLGKLESEGWIGFREERQGNRPPRRVYSLTPRGQHEFRRRLRARLAGHVPSDHPDAVSLNFLDLLPRKESRELLRERFHHLQDRIGTLREVSTETRRRHPGIDYIVRQTEFEADWLRNMLETLEHKETPDG